MKKIYCEILFKNSKRKKEASSIAKVNGKLHIAFFFPPDLEKYGEVPQIIFYYGRKILIKKNHPLFYDEDMNPSNRISRFYNCTIPIFCKYNKKNDNLTPLSV